VFVYVCQDNSINYLGTHSTLREAVAASFGEVCVCVRLSVHRTNHLSSDFADAMAVAVGEGWQKMVPVRSRGAGWATEPAIGGERLSDDRPLVVLPCCPDDARLALTYSRRPDDSLDLTAPDPNQQFHVLSMFNDK
jgi:hypothetical protein